MYVQDDGKRSEAKKKTPFKGKNFYTRRRYLCWLRCWLLILDVVRPHPHTHTHTFHSAVIDESWVHILWYKNMMNQQKRQLLLYYYNMHIDADAHTNAPNTFTPSSSSLFTFITLLIANVRTRYGPYGVHMGFIGTQVRSTWNVDSHLRQNSIKCWSDDAASCKFLRCFQKCRRFAGFFFFMAYIIRKLTYRGVTIRFLQWTTNLEYNNNIL